MSYNTDTSTEETDTQTHRHRDRRECHTLVNYASNLNPLPLKKVLA